MCLNQFAGKINVNRRKDLESIAQGIVLLDAASYEDEKETSGSGTDLLVFTQHP